MQTCVATQSNFPRPACLAGACHAAQAVRFAGHLPGATGPVSRAMAAARQEQD
jgi:hypothetical protein